MTLTDEILKNNSNGVALLLESGADVNAIDIYGFTPLIEAAVANNTQIASQLLAKGADPNKCDLTGGIIQESLMHFANNYSARNLRDYLAYLQFVIQAFATAGEFIKYQQHLVDINTHQSRIVSLSKQPILLLPVGYEGHAITFIKC